MNFSYLNRKFPLIVSLVTANNLFTQRICSLVDRLKFSYGDARKSGLDLKLIEFDSTNYVQV